MPVHQRLVPFDTQIFAKRCCGVHDDQRARRDIYMTEIIVTNSKSLGIRAETLVPKLHLKRLLKITVHKPTIPLKVLLLSIVMGHLPQR